MAALNADNVGSAMQLQPPGKTGINPLIRVRSNEDMARQDKVDAMKLRNTPHISRLANWMQQKWEAAKRAKYPHELLMLNDLRQRDGKYDPDDLEKIRKSGQPEIYMMLTATKCRAAKAWICDTVLPTDGKPWGLEPTPIPDLPPDIQQGMEQAAMQMVTADLADMVQQQGYIDPAMQQQMLEQAKAAIEEVKEQMLKAAREEAKERAIHMEDEIEDRFQEGAFYAALEECIDDLVTFPAAILKGPIVRRRKTLSWVPTETGGFTASVREELVTEYERVSPFDFYPFPQTSDIQKGGFFERMKNLHVGDLYEFIGVPGYNEAAIRAVIDEYGQDGYRAWIAGDAARAIAEGRPHEYLNASDTIEVVQMWARVPGTLLLDYGMSEEEIPDRSNSYEANVWMVGNYVIRAVLNPHPTGKRPYGIASYEKVPGQVWGKGIPRLIRDCQRLCNTAGRALAYNMMIGSGPQVAITDTQRVPVGEDIESMYPWKIWQFTADERGSGAPPIQFFQPNSMTAMLLEVHGYFSRLADDYSGVIASAYGSDNAAGAGQTASGQAMLLSNANKVMKSVIANLGTGIVKHAVEMQFMHEMMFNDDETVKGDLIVSVRASEELVVREQAAVRRNEFLNLALNSPIVQQITGLEGIRELLAQVSKTLQLGKDIVPTRQEMQAAAQQIAMLQMMQSGNMPGAMSAAGAQPMPQAAPGAPSGNVVQGA